MSVNLTFSHMLNPFSSRKSKLVVRGMVKAFAPMKGGRFVPPAPRTPVDTPLTPLIVGALP